MSLNVKVDYYMSVISSSEVFHVGDSSSLSSSVDPKQIALERCINKIKQVIQSVQMKLPSENLQKITCPITLNLIKDPVVTKCGHLFECTSIDLWKKNNNYCPLCIGEIGDLYPDYAIKKLIEEWRHQERIPTCSKFKIANPVRRDRYLKAAESCVEDGDYEEALKFYGNAMEYTNSSIHYAVIPPVYDQLNKPEEANLSRLYLSLYQLQEENFEGAINTLESCQSDVRSLIVELKLQSFLSSGNISKGLEVYTQLISLTKNLKEKRKLLFEAADLAKSVQNFDLEMTFCKEAEVLCSVISKEEWANPQNLNLPSYPQELTEFLAQDCTIWPGKKRHETHIVVPLFPQIEIDGSIVPTTLDSLDKLDKSSGGPGYQDIWDEIPRNVPAEEEFRYAVMTNTVIPGTRNKSYADQIALLPTGYEAPGILDAARAILWENRRSGTKCFNMVPWTYTRCKEVVQNHYLAVGSFGRSGLSVYHFRCDHDYLGVAGWRKF